MEINGICYYENNDFTVNRQEGTITWTNTDIVIMGDENLTHTEFYSPIAMVLSRAIHKPANEIGSYLVNGLTARGYNSRMTNAGFVEVFE